MLRATTMAFCGRSVREAVAMAPVRMRSSRFDRSSRSCMRSRKYGSGVRISRARLSFCTRSTAASAVRPVSIASRRRFIQPLSWANMRMVSSTSEYSVTARCASDPSSNSSTWARSWATASSSRFFSRGTFSAMRFWMTTRGSCRTAWPSATPSASESPFRWWLRTCATSAATSLATSRSSPAAMTSASTMAVVWSASSSSSV